MGGVSNLRIVENQETLSEIQKNQLKRVIMEGLRGKFINPFPMTPKAC